MSDLTIDNRSVIPVRMIPFITGWKLSPDVVVEILSKSEKWHRVFVPSFHLMPDDSYQPIGLYGTLQYIAVCRLMGRWMSAVHKDQAAMQTDKEAKQEQI